MTARSRRELRIDEGKIIGGLTSHAVDDFCREQDDAETGGTGRGSTAHSPCDILVRQAAHC